MFRMLTILCFYAVTVPALGTWDMGSLKVRFDLTILGIGTTAFIELPQSDTTASSSGWVQKTRPAGPEGLSSLVLWCPKDDYTICVLIDDTGYIAGLQIALDVDQFSDSIYDWSTQGFTYWTTTNLEGETKNYWTTQQYYISSETLATDPVARIASRDPDVLLQDNGIWLSSFNGELYRIPTDVSQFTGEGSDFTEQACIPWMGNHYYYNMTKETECGENSMMPWFPLVYSEQLIGVGLITYGKHTAEDDKTVWFETPNSLAVKAIVPNGPECLYNLADTPGLVTLHTYFIRHPYELTCVF